MRTKGRITNTKEDYIRAMYKIGGFTKTTIRVGDLAAHLELAKSTVSERLKELVQIKFVTIDKKSGRYILTTKGLLAAKELTYKHRIIEAFLHEVLDVHEADLHSEAEVLEHACSDEVIRRMADYLGNPDVDPHGQPINNV